MKHKPVKKIKKDEKSIDDGVDIAHMIAKKDLAGSPSSCETWRLM